MGIQPAAAFPRRALTLCMQLQLRMGISPGDIPKSAYSIVTNICRTLRSGGGMGAASGGSGLGGRSGLGAASGGGGVGAASGLGRRSGVVIPPGEVRDYFISSYDEVGRTPFTWHYYGKVTESLRRKRNENETETKRKRYRPITGEIMRQLARFRFRSRL